MRRWIGLGVLPLLACGPFFYQAPPEIGAYPERVATKRWYDFFKEASPPDPATPTGDELAKTCEALPAELKRLGTPDRLRLIDELLSANRAGDYSAERANLLHELREIAADPALFDIAGDYLAWRTGPEAAWLPRPPAEKPWDMEQAEFEGLRETFRKSAEKRRLDIENLMAQSKPELLPYWAVRLGARVRDDGSSAGAAEILDGVAAEFPNHPRAEAAWIAGAVCHFQAERDLAKAGAGEAFSGDVARERLWQFTRKYPRGRFTADAYGWMAAIAFEKGHYGEAVRRQLERLDLQPTRETTRSVLRECDFIFETLFGSFENDFDPAWIDKDATFDAEAVARHPLVARLFVQHALDPSLAALARRSWADNWSSDRWRIDFVNRRIFNAQPLVRAALPQLGAAMLKSSAAQDSATLVLLAWSAAEAGENRQALALLDRIREAPGDEALLARAIVLQRLGKHSEAVATYDRLERDFPASPLLNGLAQRRAISLARSGQAGKAAVAFLSRRSPSDEEPPVLFFDYEGLQWCDTVLQFAPLEELAAEFPNHPEGTPARKLLGDMLRYRHLASGDFAAARKFIVPALTAEALEQAPFFYAEGIGMGVDPAVWQEHAAGLESLYRELGKARAADHARIHLALGRAWLKGRGVLTLPGLSLVTYANSEPEKQELLRRKNAAGLGYPPGAVDEELDRRDEATHAIRHFLKAAESADPAIAAPALELVNETLLQRSDYSLYQRARALETDATALSLRCYDELRKRFPVSPEALRAVSYVFLPEPGPWMPGDYNPSNSLDAIISAIHGIEEIRWLPDTPESEETGARIEAIQEQTGTVPAGEAPAASRVRLKSLLGQLKELRVDRYSDHGALGLVNQLDDFIAAASLPGIGREDLVNYIAGHHGTLPPIFGSLIRFREQLVLEPDADGYEAPREDTFAAWDKFLAAYPDSPKVEAASLRRIRALAREFRAKVDVRAYYFPEAPIPNGYKRVEVRRPVPNDPERLLRMIKEHEARFPEGRYRQDLNLWKSGALIDLRRYSDAAALLLGIFADRSQTDLQEGAALNFCDLCQRLLEPGERVTVAAALHENAGAIPVLERLVEGDTYLARLRPLMPWLVRK